MLPSAVKSKRLLFRRPIRSDLPWFTKYCLSGRTEYVGGPFSEVQAFEKLKRNDRKLSPQVVAEAFKMNPAEAEETSTFSNIIAANGDYVVVGLSNVTNGSTEVSKAGLDSFKAELARREQDALIKAMREQAEVVINQAALEN